VGAIALEHVGNAFEHAGELQNYGAFFAFMNVNLAAFGNSPSCALTGAS